MLTTEEIEVRQTLETMLNPARPYCPKQISQLLALYHSQAEIPATSLG